MGIKSLTFLIKNKGSPNCIETKKLYELSGKRVAIDASLFIYQSLINIVKMVNRVKTVTVKLPVIYWVSFTKQ